MSVDRAEVKKFIKNWANTKSKPHFAVLIEGRWGCGKTHFVTSLLEDDTFTDRKPIYLSVFGIADIRSLETSLFYASASTVTKTLHKGAGLAGSIFSGALTLGSGGILGGTANLNKVVDAATSQLEKSAKNMDRALLVLDDLERCQIPMSELLGVVNRFVEHGDARVILCANTDDLHDGNFTAFKEKVVGNSFLLESDPDSALASFVAEIEQSGVGELLLRYQSDILKLYEMSGFHNLRALRQFVWQLASILERINEEYRQNDKLIQNLITQFFIFFIEFKLDLSDETANLTPSDLLGRNDIGKDEVRYVYEFSLDKDKEPTPKKRVFIKYEQHNGIRTVITVQQWISILSSGVVDADRLNAELAQSDEVAGVASWPSWRRLWHLHSWDFSDNSEHEFWSDVEDMQSNLRDGNYVEVGEFLHVVSISLMLASHQLIAQSAPDIVAQMKAYIDGQFIPNLTDERCRSVRDGFSRHLEAYDGLGFIGREDAEFKEVLHYLLQKMAAWHQAWLAKDAGKQLIEYLADDWIRFFGNLTVINHASEQRYLAIPILATIDVPTFVDTWFSLSRNDERLVVGSMKDRYEYRPELLDSEGPWWRQVQVELMHRISISKSKPRNVQVGDLIDHINSSIIERWELRQFEEFLNGNSADLSWMTRKRVSHK
ncbi:P-loop NTPase fold protein [Pseudogemmobacter faecipullorum]|uniref:KAP NTPase domain-containing protein n=1 Tax=Pseudogemmobacter faecipullorum TaxID=2755041 RepID=A0ABS8CQM5_9RHOB|nr:P-loop NTPase fold protein [Pseudogemmobacter faecipullorum]MCB5411656.1 hypothetical protein [Pseudogemmobacter faecipullorum]